MGYLMVDGREAGEGLLERNTKTCHACGAIIEYESRPIGGYLRKFRIHKRQLPNGHFQSVETVGGDYTCTFHGKVLCAWCAQRSRRLGRCVSMEQVAEATVTALAHHIDVWSQGGRLYIENLIARRVY